MTHKLLTVLSLRAIGGFPAQAAPSIYLDDGQSIDKRVADLLGRVMLAKIGQVSRR